MKLADYLAADRSRTAVLAAHLRVTPAAIRHWSNGTRSVPADRCREIESKTAGSVSRYDLRPDVFGKPEKQAA